jgi:glycine cleavage system H lipoate-binding protein
MVVLLVLLMFAGFAAIGLWRRQRARGMASAVAAATRVSEVWFHPGHAWVAPAHAGYFKVGFDELAASLAGTAEQVGLPPVGSQVFQGVPVFGVQHGGRKLEIAAPLSGRVVSHNTRLFDDAGVVSRDPYGAGWAFLLRPTRNYELGNLISGGAARRWLDQLRASFGRLAFPASAATAYDAGPLHAGFGEHLTDEQFGQLKRELFPNSR